MRALDVGRHHNGDHQQNNHSAIYGVGIRLVEFAVDHQQRKTQTKRQPNPAKLFAGERIKAKNLTFRFIENGEIKEVNPTNKAKKRILCINTNKEYESITEASKDLNVKHQHISAILNGRQKTTKGYSFKYI